jgi:hypothetical protein
VSSAKDLSDGGEPKVDAPDTQMRTVLKRGALTG